MNYAPWNQHELEMLRRMTGDGFGCGFIGRNLGRTRAAVSRRRSMMGITIGTRMPWSEDRIVKLERLAKSGFDHKRIAAEVGASVYAVSTRLSRAGLRTSRKPLAPELVDRIAQLVEKGKSPSQVGLELGVCHKIVEFYIRRDGIVGPNTRFFIRPHPLDPQLLALEAEGLSHGQMAARLGRSYGFVRNRLVTLARWDLGREELPGNVTVLAADAKVSEKQKLRWTQAQDEMMLAMRADGKADDEIAVVLDRTAKAVKQRRSTLGRTERREKRTNRNDRLIELFLSGMDHGEISAATGIHVNTVGGILRGLGHNASPRLAKDVVQRIADMVSRGCSIPTIGRLMNMPASKVRYHIRKNGFIGPKSTTKLHVAKAEGSEVIRQLSAEGKSKTEIARIIGSTMQDVRSRLMTMTLRDRIIEAHGMAAVHLVRGRAA